MEEKRIEALVEKKNEEIQEASTNLLLHMLTPKLSDEDTEGADYYEDDMIEMAVLLAEYAASILRDHGYYACNPYYEGDTETICACANTCDVKGCPYRNLLKENDR